MTSNNGDNHPELTPQQVIDKEIPFNIVLQLDEKPNRGDRLFSLKSLQKFIVDIIRGNDGTSYEEMYPIINELNVFSISSLAYHIQKQIDWKMGKKEHDTIRGGKKTINTKMFKGRAIHEFIQKRFIDRSKHWNREVEVRIHIPYPWKNIEKNEIIILGHVDLINYVSREIMELKSSDHSSEVTHYHVLQAGTYCKIITDKIREYKKDPTYPAFRIFVVKIGGEEGYNMKLLSEKDVEEAYMDVVNRALLCAKKLDMEFDIVREKLHLKGFIIREQILEYAKFREEELANIVIDSYNASRAKTLQELDLVEEVHGEDMSEEIKLISPEEKSVGPA